MKIEYHVEKVVSLNSFDSKKEAELWMRKIKKLNDDKRIIFPDNEKNQH